MALALTASMELVRTIETFTTSQRFWSTFLTGSYVSTTVEIAFEKVHKDYRRLAPFVAPNVQGKIQRRQGGNLVAFRPAYVKPKDVVDPSELRSRMPGESLDPTNPATMANRRLAKRGEILEDHRVMIDNTVEWMASQALIFGQVTVVGDDYPTTTVDFLRDAQLTRVLTGAAQWGLGTGDSLQDLKDMRLRVKDLTGANIRTILMGQGAWDKFYSDNEELFKELSDTRYRGSESALSRVVDGLDDIEWMGQISGINGQGRLDFYVVTTTFVDQKSVVKRHLPDNGVVGIAKDTVQLTDCYGAIEDLRAGPSGFAAMKWFPKNYETEDPSQEYILTQSAPLVVPGQPNGTFFIQVADDE